MKWLNRVLSAISITPVIVIQMDVNGTYAYAMVARFTSQLNAGIRTSSITWPMSAPTFDAL